MWLGLFDEWGVGGGIKISRYFFLWVDEYREEGE